MPPDYLGPTIMHKSISQPAGNYYDKYHTKNPLARMLMNGFLRSFDRLVGEIDQVGNALEIGCGEGEMSMRLARFGWQVQGCDIATDAVNEARRRIDQSGLDITVQQCDIFSCPQNYTKQDLIVCCEVLEHLETPELALEILSHISRRYVLVSVPREPIWRFLNMMRGRYVSSLGNTPGHIQHWSKSKFMRLLSKHFEVVAVHTPLPWTMALCRVRPN